MTEGHFSSTHSVSPPTTEEERFLWLRLLRSRRVGVTTFYRLMSEYGSARGALDALPEIAAQAGVDDYVPCPPEAIERELQEAKRLKAKLIPFGAPNYPKALYDLTDTPPILWARGNLELLSRDKIAIVGARNASSLGLRMARNLAAELGQRKQVIVSGLARGKDTASHEAAIKSGTIAVFAGGVDQVYPSENKDLANAVLAGGLILSEQPIGLNPQARHFPSRNRIISGLSRGVVVVEAAAKSGSLITARDALDQGREVMAVPGHPFDARAAGCNILIRDGATLVRKADDVIEALALPEPQQQELAICEPEQPKKTTPKDIAKLHQKILKRLGPSPIAEDQLIHDLKTSAKVLSPALATLELHGKILRRAGGLLSRG